MNIRSNLRWLIVTGFCGLAMFAAVAFTALLQIEVNGPIYRRVSLSKDVVEDYVPPPASLLEAALYCRMMNDTNDPAEFERYLALFRTAEQNFERLHTDYMRRVPEGALKSMMRGTAYETAERYFQIAKADYIPLVAHGEHERARVLLLSRMKPVFEKHMAAVDQIVAVANEEARTGEGLAARTVRFYTEVMAGVGLLILLVGGTLSATIARGISKQTEELQRSLLQLRALAGRLQSIREEERKSVAREIHDQLGQALTAIKIDVNALVRQWPGDREQQSEKAAAILALVDDTIQAVRRISTELRPGMLDDLGLVATVEWAGEEFQARTGTRCQLDLPLDDIVVDQERATAIFRILQETLTNVARHADARKVEVRLAREDRGLTLEVRDDGRGISEDRLSRHQSLGILGMRERALLIGGDLTITGAPGRGTMVRVTIPEALGT
jgi:signal transduction histidine kinase